jgi:hypothetical protein
METATSKGENYKIENYVFKKSFKYLGIQILWFNNLC